MGNGWSRMLMKMLFWMTIWLMVQLRGGQAIRFVIDIQECLSHNVLYEGDIVHVSFVVIKADNNWIYGDEGVDLLFCFTNKSPYHETIDFDVHVGHFKYHNQHAKDVNEAMGRKAFYKAIFESLALLGASFLQVYLLQRLFERKLGTSRV
ncbi:UNVERIFIED_CONTAM: Transmembrane emp24 domain-containing protein p24beta2 [Sesamum latifolium]|uniref:Transmembrane emp24 domain-containing protein p24beta2 n=1 Tax=Sesamum latifolium TaxID=2727402 RepID=A0AAW2WUH4_9LAMI